MDITAIYRDGDEFVLATASGCSCWDGEYDLERFPTLDALAESVAVTGDDRRYNPSPRTADDIVSRARVALSD